MANTLKISLHGPGEPLVLAYPGDAVLAEVLDSLAQQMREGHVVTLALAKGEIRVNMSHVWAVSSAGEPAPRKREKSS